MGISEMMTETSISEDDDLHICGACKQQYSDIFLFMRHKSEGNCSRTPGKSTISITMLSNNSLSNSTQPSVSLNNPETHNASLLEPKYIRLAPEANESYSAESQSLRRRSDSSTAVSNLSLSGQPAHLLLADLAARTPAIRLQDDNEEVHVNNEISEEEISQHNLVGSDRLIGQQPEWDSPWTRAAKTFGAPFPARKNVLQNLSNGSEHKQLFQPSVKLSQKNRNGDDMDQIGENHKRETDDEHRHDQLIGQRIQCVDSHGPLRCTRRNGFLDVEEDVATLLANHLTNEPMLHMYPSTSESLLSYGNISSQLTLPEPSESLNFESDLEEEEIHEKSFHVDDTVTDLSISSQKVESSKKVHPLDLMLETKRKTANNISINNNKFPTNQSVASVKLISSENLVDKKTNISTKSKRCYSCNVDGCGFNGFSSRDLVRHMRRHTGERPFKCLECGKTFARSDKLTAHLRIHGGNKAYKCNLCDYASVDRCGLVRHKRVHTDERPYKCPKCNYRARVVSHITVHLRTHTGDQPFVCTEGCGKAFKTSSDLKRHLRIHAGEKPYACPQCSYRCSMKSNLKTHVRLTHSANKSYPCMKCKSVFHSRKDLIQHEKTHADKLQHCTQCDYTSLTVVALKNHLKVHSTEKPFACKMCSFTTNKRGNYRSHMRKKHGPKKLNPVEKDIPQGSIQDLNSRFECPYCTASFIKEDLMQTHVQQHEQEDATPCIQDPVLADSADSQVSNESRSIDSPNNFSALSSYHGNDHLSTSFDQTQPVFLYRYIPSSQGSDNVRNAELLNSLNQSRGPFSHYVTIQGDLTLGIPCVLANPLESLEDSDNATSLLC